MSPEPFESLRRRASSNQTASDAEATPSDFAGPPELVVFIGLQAAGKTTFYHAHFAATHAHISKDLLRNNKRPERRQTLLIAETLATGRSIVVDNTNATVVERATLIALGRAFGARVIGYYFPTTIGASLARNRERVGRARVPDVAIFARAKQLAPPTSAEGFDALYTVAIAGDGAFTVARVDDDARYGEPDDATSAGKLDAEAHGEAHGEARTNMRADEHSEPAESRAGDG